MLPVRCDGLYEGGDLLACEGKDMLPSLNNGTIVLLLVRAVIVMVDYHLIIIVGALANGENPTGLQQTFPTIQYPGIGRFNNQI